MKNEKYIALFDKLSPAESDDELLSAITARKAEFMKETKRPKIFLKRVVVISAAAAALIGFTVTAGALTDWNFGGILSQKFGDGAKVVQNYSVDGASVEFHENHQNLDYKVTGLSTDKNVIFLSVEATAKNGFDFKGLKKENMRLSAVYIPNGAKSGGGNCIDECLELTEDRAVFFVKMFEADQTESSGTIKLRFWLSADEENEQLELDKRAYRLTGINQGNADEYIGLICDINFSVSEYLPVIEKSDKFTLDIPAARPEDTNDPDSAKYPSTTRLDVSKITVSGLSVRVDCEWEKGAGVCESDEEYGVILTDGSVVKMKFENSIGAGEKNKGSLTYIISEPIDDISTIFALKFGKTTVFLG